MPPNRSPCPDSKSPVVCYGAVEALAGDMPLRGWLVLEAEVEVESGYVLRIYVSGGLPGLRAYLRRVLTGVAIGHLHCCGLSSERGEYGAGVPLLVRSAVAQVSLSFARRKISIHRKGFFRRDAMALHRRIHEMRQVHDNPAPCAVVQVHGSTHRGADQRRCSSSAGATRSER